ncbi:hypothetical protein [Vulcanisaeta thermophila]|uniref:hypothetical protein n=1 Tax=Vulcanisaeta thermophila TaxID=867917 RepID=UPI000853EC54|nr:hypothetical protein [Vulcanisaeta thermophila]
MKGDNDLIVEFIRSIVDGIDEKVINEIIRISVSIISLLLYGVITAMRNGANTRFSIITVLTRTFTAGFMRDVFEVLMASSSNSEESVDAAGLVSVAYLLKTMFEHEPESPRPGFISPVMIRHDVYLVVYSNIKNYVEDYEVRNNVAFGVVGNTIIMLSTVLMLMLIVGMCQGIKSEGYPLGVRDFLSYALTDTTQMAISEMFSS